MSPRASLAIGITSGVRACRCVRAHRAHRESSEASSVISEGAGRGRGACAPSACPAPAGNTWQPLAVPVLACEVFFGVCEERRVPARAVVYVKDFIFHISY